jgi:hypothetical protein
MPKNWWVFPFSMPIKLPSSSLTSGSLGSGATANASRPQVSFDIRERVESCSVTCMVKEFTGEAIEKRARVANKAKVARLSSMTGIGFFVEMAACVRVVSRKQSYMHFSPKGMSTSK